MPRKKKVDPRANPAKLFAWMKKNKKPQRQYTKQERITLQVRALELYRKDDHSAKELGQALIAVRDAFKGVGKGAYEKWWKEHKLNQHRVSYCVRLAEGKIKAAKIRRATSPERMAESAIREKVNAFLKFTANEGLMTTVDQLNVEMRKLCYSVITGVARMRKWPMVSQQDEKATLAARSFEKALWEFLDAAFVEVTFEDLEQLSQANSMPASEYAKVLAQQKKSVQSETAPAATAASAS